MFHQLRSQNNFWSRLTFLNKRRILSRGLKVAFCGIFVKISDCRALVSLLRRHSFGSSRTPPQRWGGVRDVPKECLRRRLGISLFETVPGCRAYSHNVSLKAAEDQEWITPQF